MKAYSLTQYKELLMGKNLVEEENLYGVGETCVTGLTYNSKEAKKGTLFICKGATFKREYLEEAIKRGAVAYISDVKYELATEVPYLLVSDIRRVMPIVAEWFYQEPQKKLTIIGVGGTKGKTTTSFYIKAIIDAYSKKRGEKPCAILSSIITYDGENEEVAHNTTPEAMEVYRHLSNAALNGLKYVVMEVSSQALKYHRVDGLFFDVGVFLNLSEDHISPVEHQDFADYFHSKMCMFKQTKVAVVNLDSDYKDEILPYAKEATRMLTFASTDENADVKGSQISSITGGSRFFVQGNNQKGVDIEGTFTLSMPGLFNVDNALAGITVASVLGIPVADSKEGLEKAKVKGRMEIYHSKDEKIIGIVDYAHNKLSFEKLFSSLKTEFPDYSITAVFGCPGGKAFQRREELGRVAGAFADKVILTADEPGFERVADISKEIAKYVTLEGCPYVMIEDRGEALLTAIMEASGKTLVVAAGKGHEGSQKIGNQYVKTPSDIEYMEKYIEDYNNKRG